MRTTFIATLAAFSVAAFSVPANAQPVSVTVEFDDLNLADADDEKRLNYRVARAIDKICGRISPRTLQWNKFVNKCRAPLELQARRAIAMHKTEPERLAKRIVLTPEG